jgi:hypothetical protein
MHACYNGTGTPKAFEDWGPFETIHELKILFQQQARAERYETHKP